MRIIQKIKWVLKGKPTVKYTGYNCGCCGQWIDTTFEVPTYLSTDEWWDTWGLCEECINDAQRYNFDE